MHHAYTPNILASAQVGGKIALPDEEAHHVIKVLRVRKGDSLALVDGEGRKVIVSVEQLDKRRCNVSVESIHFEEKTEAQLTIAIAPTKNMDRLEWFLEKATEIGVDRIIPILTQNAERKVIKPERMLKLLISAMKQSQRLWLPVLSDFTPLQEAIEMEGGQRFLAHCEDGQKVSLEEVLKPKESATILIGPEGDFSLTEIEKALDKGWHPISLGDYRLRTETAALVSVQIFQSVQVFCP